MPSYAQLTTTDEDSDYNDYQCEKTIVGAAYTIPIRVWLDKDKLKATLHG